MSEDLLIANCAPTLAGLKTGCMFGCPYESRAALLDTLRRMNETLVPKGMRLLPLRFSETKALLYLYRPKKLAQDLAQPEAACLLCSKGYPKDCNGCVFHLIRQLRSRGEFPHEVGLFLGYPAEDVCGYIRDPAGCKCVGCWKVYGNEAEARQRFAQYKKCTRIYRQCHCGGRPLERLAVPG